MIFNISDEDKNKTGIYCITSLFDNKKYIGQTMEGFYDRWIRHSNLLKNNCHFNQHMQRAFNLYGSDNFIMTIVEICNSKENIAILEEKYINQYRQIYECYNYLSGGPSMEGTNNPFYGKKHTKESIEKISAAHIGKYTGKENYFYGVDHSGENNGFYGHKHSEESRKKMSETKSRMYKGENNPFYGKTHTKEVIDRIRKATMAAEHTKVKCLETNIIYRSIAEASRQTGINAKQISAVCSGHGKTAGKLHWTYA